MRIRIDQYPDSMIAPPEEIVRTRLPLVLMQSSDSCAKLQKAMVSVRIVGAMVLMYSLAFAEVIRFQAETPGRLPRGWSVGMTHAGAAPRWEIVRDESAPSPPFVFAQLSQDGTAGRFPLAILDRIAIVDGTVSVAFKTVAGAVDRAAGIVWRYQDPNNYYIVRANALEDNVAL